MNNHDKAVHMIETEIATIPTTQFPVMAGSVCRMAVFLAHRLDAIVSTERDEYLKRIRALEMTRYVELLKGEAA
ncbi:hypothetical protein BK660_21725 [Pseudomonas brassicacearum]|uniref:Uncharacterized protein n=1 Tax=Pseudomonas brassicacearum TaxID=930166 RepID=A0A423HXK2_9PSED|nr:hypothetical protein [Pseudomonas brassicacearum]RON17913.1 hypothetical protein BK660_21725 [Pseudomonas brassicacearum]